MLGVPKSTLSTWFSTRYPIDKSKQLEHLARIRPLAREKVQERIARSTMCISASVQKEFSVYPACDRMHIKTILAMLYWAEGAKHARVTGMKFTNTDPEMMRLFITLLRQCYAIEEPRLRVRLHLHYYHGKKESVRFWSELLQIPKEQFSKAYVKKRSRHKRFRQNFMGICFLNYGDSLIRKELMEICRQISERHKKPISVP